MSAGSTISIGVLALIVAVATDALRVGTRSWGDAFAFVLWTLGVFSVMSGTPAARDLERWLVGATADALDGATVTASLTDARFVASGLVSLLFIIGLLSIMPDGMGGPLAAFASRMTMAPRAGWRLNYKVYLIGTPLGMLVPLADLPGAALALLGWLWTTLWAFGTALG